MRKVLRRVLGRKEALSASSPGIADIFRSIFHENTWGDRDSRSGEGSNLVQTERIRTVLPELLAEFGVESMLDVPCGDWHWMRLLNLDIDYTGADIVPELILANEQRYGGPYRRFKVMDVTRDALPRVDLIFCRDLLVHLSFADIRAALERIRHSGSRYLLTTTFPGRVNQDITTGQWRPLDLAASPIGLPPPMRLINEGCTEWNGQWADKSLGLWSVVAIP